MSRINVLNDEYIKASSQREKAIDILNQIDDYISVNKSTPINCLSHILPLIEYLKCNCPLCFDDSMYYLLEYGKAYLNNSISIKTYKEKLEKTIVGKSNKKELEENISEIAKADTDVSIAHDTLISKYSISIDRIEQVFYALKNSISNHIDNLNITINEYTNEARRIINASSSIILDNNSTYIPVKTPSESTTIGRKYIDAPAVKILKDIGINNQSEMLILDLKSGGNVMISTDYTMMEDKELNEFVIAYILNYIEAFPTGSINIHLFDKNPNFLNLRLINAFQNGNDAAKRTITLHEDISEIDNIANIIVEDVFKKTSVQKPDLYSIYEDDDTNAFNLFIIRDGLMDQSGYSSNNLLNSIYTLSLLNNTGHKCGIRFLIFDDSKSSGKSTNQQSEYFIEKIRSNCSYIFNYKNGAFYTSDDNSHVDLLQISNNVEFYIQERVETIINAISSEEKKYVSINEISNSQKYDDSIIYIPIGKNGNNSIEIPISCKDTNGTLEGQCIGYMAIGQSGSGKSSFFHSVVLNGCLKYSPKELQFWLLDFKFGGASSKYRNSKIPHIKMVAENNKIDDALCLFQMVQEEMDRRNKLFNKEYVDNISDYNKIAANKNIEYLPRIIILIDEVQEIFREDNASVIQKMISSISVRMRSAGMHFIMVAQNLSEGKSYMLKEAFLPSATGRICFRVAENIPRDSGFDEEFNQRKQDISTLRTGEAYISYGKGTIQKVKLAYASPEDMINNYFVEIQKRYSDYAYMSPIVIGSKNRLNVYSKIQNTNTIFLDALTSINKNKYIFNAIIGEDAYRMNPVSIKFSQNENSSLLLLGSDKEICSSICTSIVLSLNLQNAKVHLFNADRTKIQDDEITVPHAFMHLARMASDCPNEIMSHKLSDFGEVIKTLYELFLERQNIVQHSEEDIPDFSEEFLIVNDLMGIDSFVKDERLSNAIADSTSNNPRDFFSSRNRNTTTESNTYTENIQTIVNTLLKDGYRYNIHLILAIKDTSSNWRFGRSISDMSNVILFNRTQAADQFENSFYLREMLKNIVNENDNETMAIWINKKRYSKIRPIIYKLNEQRELNVIDSLLEVT